MMRHSIIGLLSGLLVINVQAAPVYSGYAVITEAPLATDLDQAVYKTIQGRTVLEGLLEILNGSGYQLAAQAAADPDIGRLYQQPFPENQRTVGPQPLKVVLERLAGPAWFLVVDPVNRLVSFEVRRSFHVLPTAGPIEAFTAHTTPPRVVATPVGGHQ